MKFLNNPSISTPSKLKLYLVLGVAAFFVIIVLALIPSVNQAFGFNITSINPGQDNVATFTPFITITFNQPISNTSLSVSSSPDIIESNDVKGNKLTLHLKIPMDDQTNYTITLNKVLSSNGRQITGKTITFKPSYVDPSKLPKDQQSGILNWQQSGQAASKDDIDFQNTDALVSQGVSVEQIDSMEEAFFRFSTTSQKVIIDTASINPVPHDPNGNMDTINFNVKIGSANYKARLDYANLTAIRLQLYDAANKQVYNSNTVDTTDDPSQTDFTNPAD